MYLLSLNNQAYFFITLIFACVFGVAYYYRKTSDNTFQLNTLIFSGVGILEFIVYAMVGAKFGISGIIYVALANIIAMCISSCVYYLPMHDDVMESKGNKLYLSLISLVATLVILVLLATSLSLFARLSYMLVGFKFVNCSFAVTIFAVICMLVGGKRATISNIRWLSFCILVIVIVAIIVASYQNNAQLFNNLSELSANQKLVVGYYTTIKFNIYNVIGIFMGGILLAFIRVVDFKPNQSICKKLVINNIFAVILSMIFAVVGVISVATPSALASQGQSITFQAQLANGQTAYVVKSVENKNGEFINPNPGLIPPLLDEKTSLQVVGKYEYVLATNVMLQHYLPKTYKIFSFIMLILAMIMSVFAYGFMVTNLVKLQVLQYIPEYDASDLAKSWTWRVILVALCFISLIIAVFTPKWDYLLYIAILLATLYFVLKLINILFRSKK